MLREIGHVAVRQRQDAGPAPVAVFRNRPTPRLDHPRRQITAHERHELRVTLEQQRHRGQVVERGQVAADPTRLPGELLERQRRIGALLPRRHR